MNTSAMPSAQAPLIRNNVLKAEHLTKQVNSPEGPLTIVDDVSSSRFSPASPWP